MFGLYVLEKSAAGLSCTEATESKFTNKGQPGAYAHTQNSSDHVDTPQVSNMACVLILVVTLSIVFALDWLGNQRCTVNSLLQEKTCHKIPNLMG